MENADIFDLNTYDNTLFFCNNCANILTVYFNTDGVGRARCPKCGCDTVVKRFRRRFRFDLYEPKSYIRYESKAKGKEKIG